MGKFSRRRFQNLVLFAGECIYMDNYETKKHHEISDKSAKHLMSTSIKVLVITFLGVICYLGFPTYAYFFLNQLPMPVPILLPFIDETTNSGYYINIVNQVVIVVIGTTSFIAIELMNCMMKNNIHASKESIIYSLNVLTVMLNQNSTFSIDKNMEFRNMLIKLQDLDRFLIELCEVYYWKFFLQPMVLTYAVSASFFCYYVVRRNFILLAIYLCRFN